MSYKIPKWLMRDIELCRDCVELKQGKDDINIGIMEQDGILWAIEKIDKAFEDVIDK